MIAIDVRSASENEEDSACGEEGEVISRVFCGTIRESGPASTPLRLRLRRAACVECSHRKCQCPVPNGRFTLASTRVKRRAKKID
jgi:hypothetical protein